MNAILKCSAISNEDSTNTKEDKTICTHMLCAMINKPVYEHLTLYNINIMHSDYNQVINIQVLTARDIGIPHSTHNPNGFRQFKNMSLVKTV